jgi:hypothetical protein
MVAPANWSASTTGLQERNARQDKRYRQVTAWRNGLSDQKDADKAQRDPSCLGKIHLLLAKKKPGADKGKKGD